jgi:hypothetical protein
LPTAVARKSSPNRFNTATSKAAVIKRASNKSAQRSRIGNGSALLPGIDGRSTWSRRLKEVIAGSVDTLGGIDNISAHEASLIRRAATLTVQLEMLEARFAAANERNESVDPSDLDLYARVVAHLRRTLEAVGLRRRARDVTPPTPEAYFAHKAKLREEAA